MSPTIATARPAKRPLCWRTVRASSNPWVGCDTCATPADSTLTCAATFAATSSGTPCSASRMTITSTCNDCSVYTVSNMLSPLARDDSCTSRLTTAAPSRFAASSNETRVRVEGSVNRLATVIPARALLSGGLAPSGLTNPSARSSRRSMWARGRCSRVSTWRSDPSGRSCSVTASPHSLPLAREPALENDRGGGAVDVLALDATPAPAARAPRLERCTGFDGRVALIDHLDRKAETTFELGGDAACIRRERARTAVRIIRGADHEPPWAESAHFAPDGLPVGAGLMHRCGRARRRCRGDSVSGGNADAFESEIEGENRPDFFHAGLCMTGHGTELLDVDPQKAPRSRPALLERQLEHHARVDRHGEPGVLAHLALELPRFPTRVAESVECIRGTLAARHGREHVTGGRDLDRVGNLVSVVPLPARTMQHEAAVGMHGSATQHRLRGDLLAGGLELHLRQHVG